MPITAKEHITRFRKNLKQFLSLKEAGKLNGQAPVIEQKLKKSAEIAGLDYRKELDVINKDVRDNPVTFIENSKGKLNFGEINNEIATKINRQAGKIRLTQDGYKHVKKHAKEITKLGYESELNFVEKIISGFDSIHQDRGALLLAVKDKPAELAIVRLEPFRDEDFYVIKTAFPARPDYFKNKKPLWEKAQSTRRDKTTPGAVSGHNGNKKDKKYSGKKEKPAGTSGRASRKEKLPNRPSTGSPKDTKSADKRENPVKVPFTVTLEKLDKLHSIRSAKKLNKYVGHAHECYVKDEKYGRSNSHIAFRYTPDYRNKKYTLDLLLDGKLTHTACASGEDASFVTAWKEIVDKYGALEIEIRDQKHAKKVLGAKEYRRQEKALEEKPTPKSKKKSDLREKILKEFEKAGIKTTGVNEKLPETVENAIRHVNDLGYESWEKSTTMGAKIKDIVKRLSNESKPAKTYKDFPIGTHVKLVDLPETVNGKPNPLIGKTGVVKHSQRLDVDVEIKGHGTSGFLPENLEKIDTPAKPKEEKKAEKTKETYSPTFSQLAVFLAFQRAHEYDHENKLNRIENYQRKFLLGKKDALYIKETWHNREFDEDHTRWHKISKAGKYDTIYSSNFPDEKNLKPVTVDETIDVPKSKMKPAYDLDNYDKDNYKNRQKINRAVLLREIILGKMEAARYKGFDGMTDSTRYVPNDEIEWFDPAKDGWFWSRMFRNFTTPGAYNSPNHWNPGVITFDDFEFRYKGSDAGRGGKKDSSQKESKKLAGNYTLGKETTVDFKADGSIKETGHFALMEVDDIIPSHNKDCSANSAHKISKGQPRDRSLDALCRQPKFIAQNLNPTSITQGNLAFNGASTLIPDGQVIQGNGRGIALKIAKAEHPQKYQQYVEYLKKNAADWGFTTSDVEQFASPALVRILDVSKERAIELGNVVDTSQAKMNKIDAAKAYVRNLPEAKRKIIGDIINNSKGETLGEVIDDKGLKIFDQFKDLDRSDLVANNALTSEGKDFLRSVFAGLVFDSEDRKGALQAFLSLPHQIKAGIERSYGHLIPFVGSKADITPEVRGAVMIVDALNKRDGIETVDELFQSVDAFDGSFADKFSLREKALAKFLVNTSTQKEIRNAFRMYQYFITGKEDLFNPIKKTTPEIAFRLAFIEKHRMNPVWTKDTEKKVNRLDKEFDEFLKDKGVKKRTKEAADLWTKAGFKKRFNEIIKDGKIHRLKVRIQRLQVLGNDNSKEIEKLNELVGEDGWYWNEGKTQIILVRDNPDGGGHSDGIRYPQKAKFIFIGIVHWIEIDQGGEEPIRLMGPHAMLTNKNTDKLYVVPFKYISELPEGIRDKEAEAVYREWHNFAPDHKDFALAWPNNKETLPVGWGHKIRYVSDKVLRDWDGKGKLNMYEHDFDPAKRPASKKGNILIIGNLDIDGRGILN